MSDSIQDINGFMNYHYVNARSMDQLKQRLVEQFRVPARIISMGLTPNGFPYAYVHVSVNEQPNEKKSAKKLGGNDPSIIQE